VDVCVEAGEANHKLVVHGEYLLGVGGQRLRLHTKPPIRSDPDTILAGHSHEGGAVVRHDGHGCWADWASALQLHNLLLCDAFGPIFCGSQLSHPLRQHFHLRRTALQVCGRGSVLCPPPPSPP